MNRHQRRKFAAQNRNNGKKWRSFAGFGMTQAQAKAVSDRTFAGELMTCVMCGAQRKSDPTANSDWRAVTVDGETFYACTKEFPPDGASAAEFEAAYDKVIRKVLDLKRPTA